MKDDICCIHYAPALAKFGEVDTVPVSENNFNIEKRYA